MPVLNVALVGSEDLARRLGKKGDTREFSPINSECATWLSQSISHTGPRSSSASGSISELSVYVCWGVLNVG